MSEGLDTLNSITKDTLPYVPAVKLKALDRKAQKHKKTQADPEIILRLIKGDCATVLKTIPSNSIDLIVTSPPYADQRKKTYGGIHADKYVEWFMPIADELQRVLKPTGSFILNIKERVVDGERHTYVIELIIEMRKRGWLWTEEYI